MKKIFCNKEKEKKKNKSLKAAALLTALTLTLTLLPQSTAFADTKSSDTSTSTDASTESDASTDSDASAESSDPTLSEVIPNGISIEGTDVSGMTVEEANDVVWAYLSKFQDTKFTLTTADNKSVTCSPLDVGLTAANSDVALRAARFGKEGNLAERYAANQILSNGGTKDFKISLTIDATTAKEYFKEHSNDLTNPCKNATLKRENGEFTFVAGTSGDQIQTTKAIAKLNSVISDNWSGEDETIELPTETVDPEGTSEDLAQIKDLLGTYTTDYHTSSTARKTNVANGCSKINGTILYPGETLSVAETVNPMTAENGYALAGSYENGTTVETYGGGICQVSTTLYNAVMRAELEIVTRSSHSMVVAYVEPSMDAAIAGYAKDFQFKNNQDYPVFLEGTANGSTITFNVWGVETRPSNRTVSFESEITSETDPVKTFVANASLPLGTISKQQGSHTGYTARLWKIVTVDGVETERTVYNNSRYNVSNSIYAVGTAGATAEGVAEINAACAGGDEATVNAVVGKLTSGGGTTTTDTTATPTADEQAVTQTDPLTTLINATTGQTTQ